MVTFLTLERHLIHTYKAYDRVYLFLPALQPVVPTNQLFPAYLPYVRSFSASSRRPTPTHVGAIRLHEYLSLVPGFPAPLPPECRKETGPRRNQKRRNVFDCPFSRLLENLMLALDDGSDKLFQVICSENYNNISMLLTSASYFP